MLPVLSFRHDEIERDKAQSSTWPLSPGKTENNRASRSVPTDHSGLDQTVARWSHRARRTRTGEIFASFIAMTPPVDKIRPVGARAMLLRTRGDIAREFVRDGNGPDTKRKRSIIAASARSERMRLEPDELVRIKRFMELLAMHTAKRAPKTSATQRPQRPLLSKPRITRD